MGNRKQEKQSGKKTKRRSSFLTKVLILLLVIVTGWQVYRLQGQLNDARAEEQALSQQVEEQKQKNDALAADIAAGNTQEKMEEIARDELGLTSPGERVFYDVSN